MSFLGEQRRFWPPELNPRTICFTVDVEWAADVVLDDVRSLFDGLGIRATFFCTHPGIRVGAHERGLHPNYRRNGDQVQQLRTQSRPGPELLDEGAIYRHVLEATRAFAPEAKGARSHSLYYDSLLMPLYQEFGLEYDSTYQIPLVSGLRPFWKECEVLEIPIYFADHFELKTGACGFRASALDLGSNGMKVINLHPNMVFLNCASDAQYQACKPFYRDGEKLLKARSGGRGVRTLVCELLERVAQLGIPTRTLGEVNALWRGSAGRGA
jgi:hypothetical protein